jgi:hypothetical protein
MTPENPIEQNKPAPQTDPNAADKNPSVDSGIPPIASPKMEPPASHPCYKISCDKKSDGWDYAKLVAEFVGLGFLIVYTLFTAGMYCANRKAADAAMIAAKATQDSVKEAERTMRLDQRAWIHIGFTNNEFLLGQPIKVPMLIGNTGKTPARKVTGDMTVQLLKPTQDPEFVYIKKHPHFHLPPLLAVPNTDNHVELYVPRHLKGTETRVPILFDRQIQKKN